MILLLALWIAIEWALVIGAIALLIGGGPVVWFIAGWIGLYLFYRHQLNKID